MNERSIVCIEHPILTAMNAKCVAENDYYDILWQV